MLGNLFRQKQPSALCQALLYGLSLALMKGISLLMLPLTTRYLPPEQFGQLELLASVAIIGSILVGLGFESTFFRFCAHEKTLKQKRYCGGNILALSIILGLIAAVTGWYFAPQIASLLPAQVSAYQLRLVWIVFALEGIIAIPLAWLRIQDKALPFFVITTARALLQAALTLVFLTWHWGINGVLLAGTLVAVLQAVLLLAMQKQANGLILNLIQIKKYLSYSLPVAGSGLLAFMLMGFDRWLLAHMSTVEQVAIYGVAAKLALASVFLIQPFGMWWLPRRFSILQQKNGAGKVATCIALGITIVMIIAVFMCYLAPLLISCLLPGHYQDILGYLCALVLAMTFKEIAELVNIGCFSGHSTRGQLVVNLITTALGTIVMLFAIPYLAIWGVILALNLAYISKALLYYLLSQYHLPLPYPGKKLLLMALLCLLALLSTPGLFPGFTLHLNPLFSVIAMPLLLTAIARYLRLLPAPLTYNPRFS
ncbi:oligosaccharide flippase family protein [Thalassomonas viridans]|uniref:Oligosaccharide flippase family protein n=1 Tax=Thalassomonas viridans TaxID=137584 RepID=A0AAF0C566_9GAMM|nr:oligosaccharide flippase family protein [Thalassomonas viridans]WDE02997.1 oligosaccharide flippase family protein [Thalassomonas viridans]